MSLEQREFIKRGGTVVKTWGLMREKERRRRRSNLLSLLCGGAPGADQRYYDNHYHGNGTHRDHDDDQKVAVLLGSHAAVRRTHLTNVWNYNRDRK